MVPKAVLLVSLVSSLALGCHQDRPPPAVPSPQEAIENATARARPADRIPWPDEPEDGAPIAAAFVSIVRAADDSLRAKIRLFNFSEKDVQRVELVLSCQDDKGEAVRCIEPWKATRFVSSHSHVTHVVGAFLPAETAQVTATVAWVSFVDGTAWPQAKPAAVKE